MGAGHWLLVAAALSCIWAASLSKEIGITVTATVVLYDAFLVPFDRPQQPPGRFVTVQPFNQQQDTHRNLQQL